MISSNNQKLPSIPDYTNGDARVGAASSKHFTVLVFVCESEKESRRLFQGFGDVIPKPVERGKADDDDDDDDVYSNYTTPQYNTKDLKDTIMDLLLNDDYQSLTEDLRRIVREDECVAAVVRDVWGWDGS
jgi:hypothetical protein